MSVEHGEARNDRAGQVTAETVVYRPPAVLRPFVERYVGYRYLGYEPGVHLGMPGRHLTVIISFDDPLTLAMDPTVDDTTSDHDGMVSGLHDRVVEIRHNGKQHGIQLDVTPAGARALFGMPAGVLVCAAIDLSDTWSPSLAAELYERTATATWGERFAVLDEALLANLSANLPFASSARVAATGAWRMLTASDGAAKVGDIAAELGWSRRHLTDQFTAEYGLPPKAVASILRFERSLSLMKRPDRARLGEIAAACGYSDQAHMNHDWHRFAGVSPTTWLTNEQLPFVQDESDSESAE